MRRKKNMWKYIALAVAGALVYIKRDWVIEQWSKIKGE